MTHTRTLLVGAAALLALAGCGDDDDSTASAPASSPAGVPATTTAGTDAGGPPCPGPNDTVTEDVVTGCVLDGQFVAGGLQNYDNGCTIAIWAPDAEGGWGVVGQQPGQGAWSANTDDPSFVNPCE